MEYMKREIVEKTDELKRYLSFIEEVKNMCNDTDETSHTSLKTIIKKFRNKKVYDYSIIIIMLYGLLESFLENSIKNYLLKLNKLVPTFQGLPTKIIESHTSVSVKLIPNLKLSSKYSEINEKEIIKNLDSCFDDKKGYRLNVEAYTHHTANFRPQIISEFFSNIGITNILEKVKVSQNFKEFYYHKKQVEPNTLSNDIVFEILSDLAERRNEVAHGNLTEDILGISYLEEYIEFIKVFLISINEILINELLPIEFDNSNKTKLKLVRNVINNKIICVELNYLKIKIGDIIFIKNDNENCLRKGTIIKLQHDNKEIIETNVEEVIHVGIELNTKLKDNYNYYLKINNT